MEVLRLYADEAGESRFDTYEVSMQLKDFAPPADPLYVSEPEAAGRFALIRLPAGWSGACHPTLRRQILFCLRGEMRVTASTGDVRNVAAGEAWMMADTTGKGHTTEVVSEGPVDAVIVQLE